MATFRIILVCQTLSSVVSLSELMFNISRDLYEYCPITSFPGRPTNESFLLEMANEQKTFDDFRMSCCSSCSSEPDCGEAQLCCPDSEFYKKERVTCKYPVYVDNPLDVDLDIETKKSILALHEPALFMKQTCAAEFVDTDMEYSCLNARINDVDDPRNVTPVIDTLTYKVFSNIFCAKCNGLADTIDTDFFTPLFRCAMSIKRMVIMSSKEERQTFLEDRDCFYHFRSKNASLISASLCDYYESQPCKGSRATAMTESVSSTSDKYNWEACNAYTLPFYSESHMIMYKNVHCYLCNEGTPQISNTCEVDGVGQWLLSFSFYLILESSEETGTSRSTHIQSAQCPVSMFYDPYKDECRNITCSRLKAKTDAGCVDTYSSYAGIYWSISLLWKQIDTDTDTDTDNDGSQRIKFISAQAASFIKSRLPDRYTEAFKLQVFVGNNEDNQMWMYTILIWKSVAVQDIITEPTLNFLDEYGGRGKSVEINVNDTIFRFQVTLVGSIYKDIKDDGRNPISVHGREMVKSYSELKYQRDVLYSLLGITVSETLLCDLVLLDTSEYTVLEESFISLIANGVVLSETEYVIDESDNGTIYVCIDDYLRGSSPVTMRNLLEDIAIIASFACSMLSVVCLLVVLLTYLSIASLRTVPGKLNMCLCTSLLVAQTLQQFAIDETHIESVCVVFGTLIHYFWLNTLFWMNVCSFHLFRLFSFINMHVPSLIEEHLLLVYSTYACVSPLIFVLLNILVSLITSNWDDIGYGPSACYISSSTKLFYTFTLPVIVLVTLNIIFLTLTILGISRVNRPGENKITNRNNTLIFLKMSTLTGTCWVFGFLRLWTGSIVFEYLFIFANATQGLFLMVSFVCNKKVLSQYRLPWHSSATSDSQ